MAFEVNCKIVLKSDLKTLDEEVQRRVIAFLYEAGIHLSSESADALEMAPRRVDTGRLKGSLDYRVNEGDTEVYVGTDVEYAIYVHEGTWKMAPNRFIKNAFELNEQQVKDKFEAALK